jgi:hypothetical protein
MARRLSCDARSSATCCFRISFQDSTRRSERERLAILLISCVVALSDREQMPQDCSPLDLLERVVSENRQRSSAAFIAALTARLPTGFNGQERDRLAKRARPAVAPSRQDQSSAGRRSHHRPDRRAVEADTREPQEDLLGAEATALAMITAEL